MESDYNKSRKPSLPCKENQTPPYSKHQLLRISDILQDSDDEDGQSVVVPMIECSSSPRRVLGRWLSGLRRGKVKALWLLEGERKREKGGSLKGKERDIVCRAANDDDVSGGTHGGDLAASSSEPEESGLVGKESSFNIGIGCRLLYLLAASKNELSKMIEARMQVETLLRNARNELRTNDVMSKPGDVTAYSTTDCRDDSFTRVSLTSHALPESPSITMTFRSLIDVTPKREQLEAELKTELERLELDFDEDTWPGHEDEQSSIQVMIADTVSSTSPSVDSGEVIDPQVAMAMAEVHGGVPPYELERKLHELLQSRQEEQIRELEAAVHCLEQQLLEKEIEASCWKDTALAISKHVPEYSLLNLQHELQPSASQCEYER